MQGNFTMDPERAGDGKPVDPRVEKIMNASASHVSNLSDSQIRVNFSTVGKHCLVSMSELCQRLRISMADRNALIERLNRMGLKVPR